MAIITAVFQLALYILAFIAILFVSALPFIAVTLIVVGTMYFTIAIPEAIMHYLRTKRWRLLPYCVIFPGVYFGGRGRGW